MCAGGAGRCDARGGQGPRGLTGSTVVCQPSPTGQEGRAVNFASLWQSGVCQAQGAIRRPREAVTPVRSSTRPPCRSSLAERHASHRDR